MADQSFLHWPFLDDAHRALKHELDTWLEAHAGEIEGGEDDVDGTCRRLVSLLGELGLLRYTVPGKHGSGNERLDVRSLCLLRETLAYHSGLADFAFAMQGLGTGPISLFGDAAQKSRYLPGVAAGKLIAAFALSEKEAGSDVAALETLARAEGDSFVLDAGKTWISNGGIAYFYTDFARTGEAPGARGLSAFIVDATTPGLEVTERIDTIAPHPLGTLRFDGCRIPRSQQLGENGQGFRIAMATLDVFRTTVGAAALGFARRALGFARRALDEALERARSRQLFGAPLADLQMTQAALADMALAVDTSALLIYRSGWAKDNGQERVTREAAMAKLHATEAAQDVIDKAVQLFGGLGVVSGSTVEKLYREVRSLRIYEGASEVQKIIIARQALGGGR